MTVEKAIVHWQVWLLLVGFYFSHNWTTPLFLIAVYFITQRKLLAGRHDDYW